VLSAMKEKSPEQFDREFLREVIKRYGGHQEALANLAMLLAGEGDKSRAIELLEQAVLSGPENLKVLRMLGNLYTDAGRYNEGLAIDRKIIRLAPEDAVAHYNLGCSLALLVRVDEAFMALKRAIELGYDDATHMRADPDLEGLRDDPRFEALLRLLGPDDEEPAPDEPAL